MHVVHKQDFMFAWPRNMFKQKDPCQAARWGPGNTQLSLVFIIVYIVVGACSFSGRQTIYWLYAKFTVVTMYATKQRSYSTPGPSQCWKLSSISSSCAWAHVQACSWTGWDRGQLLEDKGEQHRAASAAKGYEGCGMVVVDWVTLGSFFGHPEKWHVLGFKACQNENPRAIYLQQFVISDRTTM